MRPIVLSAAMLMSGLTPLRAGVYNLDPPRKYPSDYVLPNVSQPLNLVIDHLNELRKARISPQNPSQSSALRLDYEKQRAQLEAKRRQGTLDAVDRVNLSGCLIRLGEFAAAQQWLEEDLRLVPRDSAFRPLLLLNAAAACQEDESLWQRALELQREALESWPALLPGWNRAQSSWFRHVEEYSLHLMRLRNRERLIRGSQPIRESLPPDLLFPKEEVEPSKRVQFQGASGQYEAGGIAWKQWERLPADAEQVVLQLLLWRPLDPRLFWLFGELLNARGQVDSAHDVLYRVRKNDLWRNRDLDRHIRVLSDALAPYRELFVDSAGMGENRRKQALLLWSLAPRGASLAPPIGILANEVGGVAASTNPTDLSAGRQFPEMSISQGADAPRSASALPDWRQLTISFITGAVVAALCLLQWRQWRRPSDRALTEPRP
jgi:tetratricopeptide (TPR) repeat protein